MLKLVPGVRAASSTGDDMGPTVGPIPVAVEVDLDLLRSAPFRLETPTPDGSVLVAEQSVFENRGGGDLMWSGGQPGAGYDTVVLTLEGGRFVGRFGGYRIHAGPDGRGGMAPVVGSMPENWCGVDSVDEADHVGHAHAAAGVTANPTGSEAAATNALADLAAPSMPMSNPQSHDRLDILVVYTTTAAKNWAHIGGPEAGIRHAGDYLKMAFWNNQLGVEPHIVHVVQASARVDQAGRNLESPFNALVGDAEVKYLRRKHRADMVHLFTGDGPALLGPCGAHVLLRKGGTAQRGAAPYGWTSNHAVCSDYLATFVHEIGHGLGANHAFVSTREFDEAYRPYALGHANLDVMPTFRTLMDSHGAREPLFSTTRIRPFGAVVGVADERDNERLLRETIHIGVRYSDYLKSVEGVPAPPADLRVSLVGDSARLSWRATDPSTDTYRIWYEGTRGLFKEKPERFGPYILRIEGRTETTIPLKHRAPDTVYNFSVAAIKGEEESPWHSLVALRFPEPLRAPSDVSFTRDPLTIGWTDNSDNERGFLVVIYEDGEPIAKKWEWANKTSSSLPFHKFPHGFDRFQVRVFARTHSGESGSETVAYRWKPPLAPEIPTNLNATAIGPTTVRVSWSGRPESDDYRVAAILPQWRHDVWPLTEEWVDFEGLARGGRYSFRVFAHNDAGSSGFAWAYLTLGARGWGPAAPSDLSYVLEGDTALLSWKDNADDELGYEVVTGRREELLPPSATSARVSSSNLMPGFGVRVYAFNEKGFSARSNPIVTEAEVELLSTTPRDRSVDLTWRVRSRHGEQLTGMQVRWKAAVDLPFADGTDAWTDLLPEARTYTVAGLENGTEYVFEVRAATAFGGGHTNSSAARPHRLPAGSCKPGEHRLCLRNARFGVEVSRLDATLQWSGSARVVNEGTEDSGLFYFFDPDNWEILVKVLDGCAVNGHMWALAASTTDLGYVIAIWDTITDEYTSYRHEGGTPSPAIVDAEAFSEACDIGASGR